MLLWLDRPVSRGASSGPPSVTRARAALYRWILWLADTLHPAWWPIMKLARHGARGGRARRHRARGREQMDSYGAYLERELAKGPWCLGEQYSVADMYLYMLVGWENYIAGGYQLGGERVHEHYRRVGERPAVVRARELDDLDERLIRHHPELRGGRPI